MLLCFIFSCYIYIHTYLYLYLQFKLVWTIINKRHWAITWTTEYPSITKSRKSLLFFAHEIIYTQAKSKKYLFYFFFCHSAIFLKVWNKTCYKTWIRYLFKARDNIRSDRFKDLLLCKSGSEKLDISFSTQAILISQSSFKTIYFYFLGGRKIAKNI